MSPPLAEKVSRTRLLLETLDDPYPSPRGALRSEPGPAPSRYVPCLTCHRKGWVKRRRQLVLCLVCDGRGERRRRAGEQPWEAYLGMPLQEAPPAPPEPFSARRLEQQIAEQEGHVEALSYGWERLRQAYDRAGSYQELRRQLRSLSVQQPRRHRLVQTVLVEHDQRDLSPRAALELELGVVAIAIRMRSVRVPGWLLEHAAARERTDTIASLAAEGLTAGVIARRLGMSKEAVRRKLRPAAAVDSVQAGIPLGAM